MSRAHDSARGVARRPVRPALFLGVLAAVLLIFLIRPQIFGPIFAPLVRANAPAIYTQADLLSLTLSHLLIVTVATTGAVLVSVTLAVLVSRPIGRTFLPLSRSIVNIGQTFPPVAVLALAVPLMGFGEKPTLMALFLYGLLPIFENALTGLTTLPRPIIEAARGAGMTGWQRLWRVEIPLALPSMIAGIRLSAVISLSTATIGSTVAARTLGEVIIAGLQSNNLAFIVQGGLIVAALAVLIHGGFSLIEAKLSRFRRI